MMSNEESIELYGTLMRGAMENVQSTGERTDEEFVRTVQWIKAQVYNIDMNPRYATLVLFLRYNLPDLEQYAKIIWDNFNI